MQNNTGSLMLLYNKPQVPFYQGNCILVWLFISEKNREKKYVDKFRNKQQKERGALKCLHLETKWRVWDSWERKFITSNTLKIFISSILRNTNNNLKKKKANRAFSHFLTYKTRQSHSGLNWRPWFRPKESKYFLKAVSSQPKVIAIASNLKSWVLIAELQCKYGKWEYLHLCQFKKIR